MKSNKVFLLGAALALLFLAACASESQRTEPVTTTTDNGASTAPPAKEADKRDKALVRVVHALPGFAAVDTYIGSAKEFNDVTYKTVTPYKEVPNVRAVFAIKPTGKEAAEPFAQNSEGVSGGDHYTAIALPDTDGKAMLKVISDKLTPPPAGKASVRFINASPDAGEVDVVIKGKDDNLFGGVNADSVTNYKEVDPATLSLEVRPQGKKNVLLTVPAVGFDAGHLYTIVMTGKAKGAPKLESIKIDDQLMGAAKTASTP
jgi:hypothetical protein